MPAPATDWFTEHRAPVIAAVIIVVVLALVWYNNSKEYYTPTVSYSSSYGSTPAVANAPFYQVRVFKP